LAQEAESNLRKALAILEQNQQQLRTLQQLADLLNQQITNLPNLLQLIVHAICEAVSTADFGMVLLQNPYTELLELAAATGIGDDFLHVYPAVVPGEGVLGELFLAGESRLIQDGSQELDASLPLSPASLCAVTIESAQAGKLGILVLGNWNNPAAFDADHLQLLLAFGEQAAIALTNAQLIRALEEREARLGLQNQMLSDQNQTLEIQQQHIQLQNLKLQEATQLKSEFIATMSHELRTPMNAVIGFSQLLLRQQGLSPKQADMVARILNNGRHLLSLINDILDFSKIEAGRLALNLEEMNLHHLMTETVEELRSLAEQKDLCLDIQIHLNDPIILNDRIRLRQVVINLISNAIKFTEVGTVRVTVQDLAADNLILSVQDTGIGIAKKDVHHIFEAFRQVDQSLAKSFPGTGLGLAITDLLVDSMHGSISVDSQVGQGSTFRVTFPRRVPQSLPSLADEE
jgi:signal transduction histidine kinase